VTVFVAAALKSSFTTRAGFPEDKNTLLFSVCEDEISEADMPVIAFGCEDKVARKKLGSFLELGRIQGSWAESKALSEFKTSIDCAFNSQTTNKYHAINNNLFGFFVHKNGSVPGAVPPFDEASWYVNFFHWIQRLVWYCCRRQHKSVKNWECISEASESDYCLVQLFDGYEPEKSKLG